MVKSAHCVSAFVTKVFAILLLQPQRQDSLIHFQNFQNKYIAFKMLAFKI